MTPKRSALSLIDVAIGISAAAALLIDHAGRRHTVLAVIISAFLATATGAALTQRRRVPLTSFIVTIALVLVALPVAHNGHAAVAVAMLSAATVAFCGRRKIAVLAAIALTPCVALGFIESTDGNDEWSTFGVYLVLTLAAVAAGDALRSRQEASREREAARDARQSAIAQARFDERRMQLARDLHDSVGHALVAINTQAAIGVHLHGDDVDLEVLQTLVDIKAASATALDELRATVRELRDAQPAEGTAKLTADAIERLVTPLRARTIAVHLDFASDVDDSRAQAMTVDAVGYRIIQESLTNVLRHAVATQVIIRVARTSSVLDIQVHNDGDAGRRWAWHQRGHGLLGMGERVAAVGGSLEAGPVGDGWRVQARLPACVVDADRESVGTLP